jgi:probable HAF family extracellular repeat protein
MIRRIVATTAVALLTLGAGASTQPQRVLEAIEVGPGTPVGINSNNQIALVNGYRSFFWSEWGGLTDLGGFDPDVPQTRAFAISDRGQVAGSVLAANGFYHPFLWTPVDGLIDPDPQSDAEWAAWAVNNAGDVVGGSGIWPGLTGQAYRRTADGNVTALHPLGACGGAAYDINDFGIAVGESGIPGGCDEPPDQRRPFVWTGTSVRDLGTFGGAQGVAVRINSLNQVTGHSTTAAGDWRAFLWSEREGMRELGTLGGSWSLARAVSEMGHVVGTAADARGRTRAFLWTPSRGMVDLGPGEAVGVNEFDHVVGYSRDAAVLRAFLWTPWDGRVELAADARAVDVNRNGYIVGSTNLSQDARTVVWRIAVTEADWLTYRRGLVDAHLAYGTLNRGQAQALRAFLNNAARAIAGGDQARAEHFLAMFGLRFARWAAGELPWQ